MKKVKLKRSIAVSLGLQMLLASAVFVGVMTLAPKKADAYCYTRRVCHWSYGRRYCSVRRTCTGGYYTRRCYYRRRCYNRRYCSWRYGHRYCYWRSYCRPYRVCY
ncbi:MAG: hypothetical protein KC503_27750 [Myxococcales bacterium]|nr:hypothetical protein [Myxococcales bacterium]